MKENTIERKREEVQDRSCCKPDNFLKEIHISCFLGHKECEIVSVFHVNSDAQSSRGNLCRGSSGLPTGFHLPSPAHLASFLERSNIAYMT